MQILIIGPDRGIAESILEALKDEDHDAQQVDDGRQAMRMLNQKDFDVAVVELSVDDEDSFKLLPKLIKKAPHLQVIVAIDNQNLDRAMEGTGRSASYYLTKPFTPAQVRHALDRASQTGRMTRRMFDLDTQSTTTTLKPDFSSEDPAMQAVLQLAAKVAKSSSTLLLLGESGTGKSVLAREIHRTSRRRKESFVTVSCPSLNRELLESELFGHMRGAFTGAYRDHWGKVAAADGGTLFLDEIGDLPLEVQPKLLRLLQDREYERVGESRSRRSDVRIITATNRDLEALIEEGLFREDLFYRLSVINLHLPPLRERNSDLERIAERYLEFFAAELGKPINGFNKDVLRSMRRHSWPGNLRELRNYVERAVLLCDGPKIRLEDVAVQITGSRTPRAGDAITLKELEAEHIKRVSKRCATQEEAARILGVDATTLYRRKRRAKQTG